MFAPENLFVSPNARVLVHIGNIAAQWSHLEYMLAQTIWILLGHDAETGKIVTGGLDMLPRINMAINLARHLNAPKPLTECLEKIRKELQANLIETRNSAIHGVQFNGPNGELEVEMHRGKGNRKRNPLPEKTLNQTGKRLYELTNELRSVFIAHANELRLALLNMAKNIELTVSSELGPPPSGSNSQKA